MILAAARQSYEERSLRMTYPDQPRGVRAMEAAPDAEEADEGFTQAVLAAEFDFEGEEPVEEQDAIEVLLSCILRGLPSKPKPDAKKLEARVRKQIGQWQQRELRAHGVASWRGCATEEVYVARRRGASASSIENRRSEERGPEGILGSSAPVCLCGECGWCGSDGEGGNRREHGDGGEASLRSLWRAALPAMRGMMVQSQSQCKVKVALGKVREKEF